MSFLSVNAKQYLGVYKGMPFAYAILLRLIFQFFKISPLPYFGIGSVLTFCSASYLFFFNWSSGSGFLIPFSILLTARIFTFVALFSYISGERMILKQKWIDKGQGEVFPSFTFYHTFSFGKALGVVLFFLIESPICALVTDILSGLCFLRFIQTKELNEDVGSFKRQAIAGILVFVGTVTLCFFSITIAVEHYYLPGFLSIPLYLGYCFYRYRRTVAIKLLLLCLYEALFGVVRGIFLFLPILFSFEQKTFSSITLSVNCFIIQFLVGFSIVRNKKVVWGYISILSVVSPVVLFFFKKVVPVPALVGFFVTYVIYTFLENLSLGETQDLIADSISARDDRDFHVSLIYCFLNLMASPAYGLIEQYHLKDDTIAFICVLSVLAILIIPVSILLGLALRWDPPRPSE